MDQLMDKILQMHAIDFDRDIYGRSNNILSNLVGIGRDQSPLLRRSIAAFVLLLYVSAWALAVDSLVDSWSQDYNDVVENSLFLVLDMCFVAGYLTYYSNVPKLELLNSEATKFWQSIGDKDERKRLHEFLRMGCLAGTIGSVYVLCLAFLESVLFMALGIFNASISSTNSTRSPVILYQIQYKFLSERDCYLLSSLHLTLISSSYAILIAVIVTIAPINLALICGSYSLLRFRNIVSSAADLQFVHRKKYCLRNLSDTVDLHHKAMEFCDLVEQIYYLIILATEGGGIIMLALLYFTILYGTGFLMKKVVWAGLILAIVGIWFLANFAGQLIINYSDEMIHSIYCCDWYLASPKDRECIQMIMQRSQRPPFLTAGKISILCMESFSQLMKLSCSYFTAVTSFTLVED